MGQAAELYLDGQCIGCGCRSGHACVDDCGDPCYWIAFDSSVGLGLCSECGSVENVRRFQRGDRTLSEFAQRDGWLERQ